MDEQIPEFLQEILLKQYGEELTNKKMNTQTRIACPAADRTQKEHWADRTGKSCQR